MNRGGFSRFIPLILFVGVIVVVIAALISIGGRLFGSETSTNDPGETALVSMDVENSVRMTARGAIVSQEEHRSYQIEISPEQRSLVAYEGYLERPLEAVELGNNSRAYEEFVYALSRSELMRGNEGSEDEKDLRGRCPKGSVYVYETINASGVVKRLWTSTCRGESGTLKANHSSVRDLFLAQIPEGQDTIRPLRIR